MKNGYVSSRLVTTLCMHAFKLRLPPSSIKRKYFQQIAPNDSSSILNIFVRHKQTRFARRNVCRRIGSQIFFHRVERIFVAGSDVDVSLYDVVLCESRARQKVLCGGVRFLSEKFGVEFDLDCALWERERVIVGCLWKFQLPYPGQ